MKQKNIFKKLLTLVLLLVASTTGAWADETTFNYSDYKGKGTSSSGSSYTMDDKLNVSIGDTKFYGNNNYAHFYANGTTTITPKNGVTITSVVLTASAEDYNGYQSSGTVTPSIGKMSHEDVTVTWTGSATEAFTISHNKQIRWTSIVVTHSAPSSNPLISASNVEIEYDATAGTIESTIINPVAGGVLTAAKKTTADWLTLGTVSGTDVSFTATANDTNEDREAKVTLTYTYGSPASTVTKDVTITQGHLVVDYATLPFAFDGGKSAIETTTGLTHSGLGSDYGSSPKLKFDTTGDYLVLKINETPGILSFDIKGNSFSGGTFKVQASSDGENYTDVATYTSLDNTENKEIDNLASNVRYIKWIYTEKSSGNVALGNISLVKPATPKTATTTTIDASGINTNLDEGTAAGQLTASVKAGETPVGGATVTWTSSNEKVATVDAEGIVTLKKKGTTTITATYAGDETYASSSGTYVLNVTSEMQPTEVETGSWNALFGTSFDGSLQETQFADFQGTIDNVKIEYLKGTADYMYIKNTEIRIYNGNSLRFTAPAGYVITRIDFTGSVSADKAPKVDTGNFYRSSDIYWEGTSSSVKLYRDTGTGQATFNSATITLALGTNVTDAKWATYVTPKDIDFAASTGVTAYKVTGTDGKIELEEVDAAPKGTPLVIAANESGYVFVEAASAPAAVTGNLLKAADGNQTGDGTGNFYVLGKDNQGKVGFGPLGDGVKLAIGKAYILGTDVTAKGFLPFVIGDEESETTSISEELRVKSEESSAYNLAGQKVSKDYKGIVVVNGKKVIRK